MMKYIVPESSISDKSTLRDLVSGIKNLFFEQFGADVPEFGTQVDDTVISFIHTLMLPIMTKVYLTMDSHLMKTDICKLIIRY